MLHWNCINCPKQQLHFQTQEVPQRCGTQCTRHHQLLTMPYSNHSTQAKACLFLIPTRRFRTSKTNLIPLVEIANPKIYLLILEIPQITLSLQYFDRCSVLCSDGSVYPATMHSYALRRVCLLLGRFGTYTRNHPYWQFLT